MPAKCLKILGKNINGLLAQKGLSQSELARRINVTPAFINQILAGSNSSPKWEKIEKIAEELGTSLPRLLEPTRTGERVMDVTEALRVLSEFLCALRSRDLEKLKEFSKLDESLVDLAFPKDTQE